jgi:hypothetical protein
MIVCLCFLYWVIGSVVVICFVCYKAGSIFLWEKMIIVDVTFLLHHGFQRLIVIDDRHRPAMKPIRLWFDDDPEGPSPQNIWDASALRRNILCVDNLRSIELSFLLRGPVRVGFLGPASFSPFLPNSVPHPQDRRWRLLSPTNDLAADADAAAAAAAAAVTCWEPFSITSLCLIELLL